MDKARPDRGKTRSYTVVALLGLFVVAAILALASRLLPGGRARLARHLQGGDREDRGAS
jgi:hypothetical protein